MGFASAPDSALAGEPVRFHTETVALTELEPAALQESLSSWALRADARHFIVQFDGPLSRAERAGLETAGLRLLNYLGSHAYFASSSGAGIDTAGVTALRAPTAVEAIQTNWKMHPDFAAGGAPEWARAPRKAGEAAEGSDVVAAYVLFHPDVPYATEGTQLVWRHGGWVRSQLRSINGLVIHLPLTEVEALAAEDAVQWIEPPLPPLDVNNDSNRAITGANIVHQAPYGLDGSGVSVLVYDGGTALASHADFGGRLAVRDTSGLHYHSTHVAGTVGGSGVASGGTYKGMAPGVIIESYGFEQEGGLQQGFLYTDPGDLEEDYDEAINTYGVDISNNSIGTNTAPNGYPCDWEGNYGATGALIDAIVRGSLGDPFRIVWANGNERSSGRCGTTYHTTAPPACAKNHITIGAMNSNDDSVTYFTSWGPTDDGRIKPDVSAPGCQSNGDNGVTSCDSDGGYRSLCGTSMAAPTACGLSALLLQDFRNQYPDEPDFRNSTLKALFAQTAVDLEEPGPDYKTGYGSIRIQAAVDLMRAGNFLEDEVDQDEIVRYVIVVGAEDDGLKVTLAWDDVPGTPDVMPVLVNDLDLRVYDSTDTLYYPYTLDPDNPSVHAVTNQEDHANNIEQVHIPGAPPGAYRVEVHGYNLPAGLQSFSLAGSPLLISASPMGLVSLDRNAYACTSTATLQVTDTDLNTYPGVVETAQMEISSESEPEGEIVMLTETGPGTSVFEGSISLNTVDSPGVLLVADGNTVTATYIDEDDGQGGENVEVTDTAAVDCIPPMISGVSPVNIQPHSATITFDTDEDANSTIRYGTSCAALYSSVEETGFHTLHAIPITGVEDDRTHYYVIDAVDQAGNGGTDDNGGACYTFATPYVPDFFTEVFENSDNDLDNTTLTFQPDGGDDFYRGCALPEITELPTDPTGGASLSFSPSNDDGYAQVNLTGGELVSIYGQTYSSFYVGSNGYITFTQGDTDYSETLSEHFNLVRVAALYDDLDPGSGGTVSYKQLADRVAVTYDGVVKNNTSYANTFQIELFFDGTIAITYLDIAIADGLAGLSDGTGLDPQFYESDLSALSGCGPQAPKARGGSLEIFWNDPFTVELQATDDGLPDPPAALEYIITELPANGTLSDPGAGAIVTAPYTLVDNGNEVVYAPDPGFHGQDPLRFKANDGGVPEEGGGDSNVATIIIQVLIPAPEAFYSFPLNEDPGWSVEGSWAFGQPTGNGTHNRDPNSGYTGANVYGYNLAGDYTINMEETLYLTTPALDCSNLVLTELRFRRWLGVEGSQFDHAGIEVSHDGQDWVTIWGNAALSLGEFAWSYAVYDISAVADGRDTVYIRWGMGPTDDSVTYPGWNLDDIQVWAREGVPVRHITSSDPADGAIDARQPLDPNTLEVQGWSSVQITFDGPVDALTEAKFTLEEVCNMGDCDGVAPGVDSVETNGGVASLTLDRPLDPLTWTVISYVDGNENDVVRLGFLPADADGSLTSNANDIVAVVDGVAAGEPLHQYDIDRTGTVTANDIVVLIDLLNGATPFEAYFGKGLPLMP